jgi:hypothetical protein
VLFDRSPDSFDKPNTIEVAILIIDTVLLIVAVISAFVRPGKKTIPEEKDIKEKTKK